MSQGGGENQCLKAANEIFNVWIRKGEKIAKATIKAYTNTTINNFIDILISQSQIYKTGVSDRVRKRSLHQIHLLKSLLVSIFAFA